MFPLELLEKGGKRNLTLVSQVCRMDSPIQQRAVLTQYPVHYYHSDPAHSSMWWMSAGLQLTKYKLYV